MPDEEAFLVVVSVDKPAGDAVGAVATDLAGIGVEDIHTVDLYAHLAVFFRQENNIRLAEDDEEIAFTRVLEVAGHVQVGVHAGLEYGEAAELAEFGGMRLVVEGAGNQHIKPRIAGLAGGSNTITFAELNAERRCLWLKSR